MRVTTKILSAGVIGTALLFLTPLQAAAQDAGSEAWGGAWGYATSPATQAVRGELPPGVYRFRLRLSQSGDALRLTFTNPTGARPLKIASAVVAPLADGTGFGLGASAIAPVAFGGEAATMIAGGDALVSDPIALSVASGDDVVVSVAVSDVSTTVGGNAGFPLAFAAGAGNPATPGESELSPLKLRPFVTLAAVRNPSANCTVVAFGDSITEGARGTRQDWRGWPGVLAQRLIAEAPQRHCGVVNMGISGNRLLRDGRGTAGVERFDRDVASVPGATHLIVLEGINDIWRGGTEGEGPLTAEDIVAGYGRLIAAGHDRGLRVIGGTLTPGMGSRHITRDMEGLRQTVNRWIRTSGAFDAVIDFEAAVRDTATPPQIRPLYDSGDKLHPGDGGYQAMGRAVPLDLVQP